MLLQTEQQEVIFVYFSPFSQTELLHRAKFLKLYLPLLEAIQMSRIHEQVKRVELTWNACLWIAAELSLWIMAVELKILSNFSYTCVPFQSVAMLLCFSVSCIRNVCEASHK